MKLGSLFDGIGGFPLAASRYGIIPVWASEIEPFPVKVTQKHFPGMKHLGDITQINGAEIEPVDVITFGSPCQDLSVAGKREGLAGERSGLFMEAVRIIQEMRRATGGKYPRFAVWENVPGAFSSHGGQDFRAVLEEIGNAQIPMPKSGKWATAGMVRTETADIAWRTIDAQHWGVPQRRRRIFLVADFAGTSAGEILFVEQGLSGDSAESGEARQETAGDVGTGSAVTMRMREGCAGGGKGPLISEDKSLILGCSNDQTVFTSRINSTFEGISGAVSSKWAKGTGGPAGDECYNLVIKPRSQDGVCDKHRGVVPTLNTAQGGQRQPCVMDCFQNTGQGGMAIVQLYENHGQDSRYTGPLDVAQPVTATYGMGGNNQPFVVKPSAYTVRRLTPTEALRLQGFPDWWLDIEGASDTAKYKAIGNSIAIPCVDFVMSGIARVLRREGR